MKNDKNDKSRVGICLDKAHKYFEEWVVSDTLPDPDELGYIKVKYQDMRKMLNERYKLGWSAGACYMLASVDIDRKRGVD